MQFEKRSGAQLRNQGSRNFLDQTAWFIIEYNLSLSLTL